LNCANAATAAGGEHQFISRRYRIAYKTHDRLLRPLGDTLDGDIIVSRENIPYQFAYTYDILPASSTGIYVANGVLIGSTLK